MCFQEGSSRAKGVPLLGVMLSLPTAASQAPRGGPGELLSFTEQVTFTAAGKI